MHRVSNDNKFYNKNKNDKEQENGKKYDSLAYKPSEFRDFIETAIEKHGYRNNTAFWELYLWNENHMKIDNRVNNFLDKQLKK